MSCPSNEWILLPVDNIQASVIGLAVAVSDWDDVGICLIKSSISTFKNIEDANNKDIPKPVAKGFHLNCLRLLYVFNRLTGIRAIPEKCIWGNMPISNPWKKLALELLVRLDCSIDIAHAPTKNGNKFCAHILREKIIAHGLRAYIVVATIADFVPQHFLVIYQHINIESVFSSPV